MVRLWAACAAVALGVPAMAQEGDVVDDWPCERAVALLRETEGAGLDGLSVEQASQLTALLYYLSGVADAEAPLLPFEERRDQAIRHLFIDCAIRPGLSVSDLTRAAPS